MTGLQATPWRAIAAGLCASLVGIGLARFAYTPLIPALVIEDWFTASQAAYLGAANLAGYLAGALLARPMAARAPAAVILRAMMVVATAAFFACAFPLSFAWFFVWRFAAGLAGGTLMVLAAPIVLPHVPPARRGLASGAIFTGVGLGIAASGTAVPLLMRIGLFETWIGLGLISLILTALAWGGWPADRARTDAVAPPAHADGSLPLKALYVEYGLNAAGLVPHMVFLVDFIARGLDKGLAVGGFYWVLFGLGAVAGPLFAGHVADRIGFRAALRLIFAVQALAVALPLASTGALSLTVSSIVVGASVPGVVPLVLGRVHELTTTEDAAKAGWSLATTTFALGQAAAAYLYSYLFALTGGYALLFAIGAAALALGLAIDLAAGRRRQ